MNGHRAKAIRRAVYGDFSQREPRQYVRVSRRGAMAGFIANHPESRRAQYQRAKAR